MPPLWGAEIQGVALGWEAMPRWGRGVAIREGIGPCPSPNGARQSIPGLPWDGAPLWGAETPGVALGWEAMPGWAVW